jgi:hypothetical protein
MALLVVSLTSAVTSRRLAPRHQKLRYPAGQDLRSNGERHETHIPGSHRTLLSGPLLLLSLTPTKRRNHIHHSIEKPAHAAG